MKLSHEGGSIKCVIEGLSAHIELNNTEDMSFFKVIQFVFFRVKQRYSKGVYPLF